MTTDDNGSTYKLTISSGVYIRDYSCGSQPWHQYAEKIKEIVFSEDYCEIGEYAFEDCAIDRIVLPERGC